MSDRPSLEKLCRDCGEKLVVGENISAHRDSQQKRQCRPCENVRRKAKYDKERVYRQQAEAGERLLREGTTCLTCDAILVLNVNWFASYQRRARRICRECSNKTTNTYRRQRPGRYASNWRGTPEYYRDRAAAKRAKIKNAMPVDADRAAIRKVYELADRVSRIIGTSYHVDHIQALNNGGLHHHDNLVVMRADWNIRKGANDWLWLKWFNDPIQPADRGGDDADAAASDDGHRSA